MELESIWIDREYITVFFLVQDYDRLTHKNEKFWKLFVESV